MQIIPTDHEGQRLIAECRFNEGPIYRAKYGGSPFRIIFGIEESHKLCYVFAVDLTHESYSGKNRK